MRFYKLTLSLALWMASNAFAVEPNCGLIAAWESAAAAFVEDHTISPEERQLEPLVLTLKDIVVARLQGVETSLRVETPAALRSERTLSQLETISAQYETEPRLSAKLQDIIKLARALPGSVALHPTVRPIRGVLLLDCLMMLQ